MKINDLLNNAVAAAAMVAVLLCGRNAGATIYTWANTSGGTWGVATNWNPNGIPGSGDTALITTPGTYAVALNAAVSVNLLTVGTASGSGTQSFSTSSNNLTVQNSLVVSNSGVFTLDGGTMNVNGTVQGLVTWTAGILGSDGTHMGLATNATLILAGSNGVDYIMGQYVTNAGTIEVQSGNLALNYCSYYGGLQNLPGGLIDLQGDVSIDGCGGLGLSNQGTLRKSAGTGVSTIDQLFQNTGVVDVETGTLLLNGDSSDANGSYIGAGNVLITNATFSETGTLIVSNLNLAGGRLAVNGALQGSVTWTGGQFGAGGNPMTLTTNSTLVLAGTNGIDYIFGEYVTNAGTILVESGNLSINYCSNYGALQNLPGALIELQGDVSIDGCGGDGLINAGTLLKSAGTGVSAINQLFHNTGTVTVETGSLVLEGASSDANGVYDGAGALVVTNASFSENGSLSVSNMVMAGGYFSGNGILHGLVTWTGGIFGSGNNHFTIATNGTVVLAGLSGTNYVILQTITNAGIFRVSSGNLFLEFCGDGEYGQMINLPGGLVDLAGDVSITGDECSPGLANFGTVRKSSGTGISAIDAAFQNEADGTVDVETGTILFNAPTTDNGGSYIGAGTALITNATLTVNGTLTSANIVLAGGNLLGTGTIEGLITWTGGLIGAENNQLNIAPNGTIVLAGQPGVNYTIGQPVANAGVIRVTGGTLYLNDCSGGYYGQLINLPGGLVDLAGDVSITGDNCSLGLSNGGTVRKSNGTGTSMIDCAFHNQATGVLDIETGSVALTNKNFSVTSGTLQFLINNATNYTKLILPATPAFGGSLAASFTNGYAPANGTVYTLISYPSFTGSFTALELPQNLFWQQIYGVTNYALRVVTGPVINSFDASGNNAVFAGTDGMPSTNYVILTSTNLFLPLTNWTILSTNYFDALGDFRFTNEIAPAPSQQYFEIRAQ